MSNGDFKKTGSYKITTRASVEKELRRLPHRDISKIRKRIKSLTENPFPPQSQKLSGSKHDYHLRSGDYRILYSVDFALKQIEIFKIRHRKDAYR